MRIGAVGLHVGPFGEKGAVEYFDAPLFAKPLAEQRGRLANRPAPSARNGILRRMPTPATRSDEAYDVLRREIVRGALRPNQRLIEVELAERLQMSRTPVREGLQRLARDGLIVSHRRGWVVRDHTRDEIREIYEVRIALESYAARLAAKRASDAELRCVRKCQERARAALRGRQRSDLVDANDSFHSAVVAASGNPRLVDVLDRSCQYYFNYRIAVLYSDEEAAASIAGHDRLLRALEAREAAGAERAARAHVTEALAVTLEKLR